MFPSDQIAESTEREHETRCDELVDREGEADRDDVGAQLQLDDREDRDDRARVDGGEESTRADRDEREPLRTAGDDRGVDALEATYGSACPLRQRSESFSPCVSFTPHLGQWSRSGSSSSSPNFFLPGMGHLRACATLPPAGARRDTTVRAW